MSDFLKLIPDGVFYCLLFFLGGWILYEIVKLGVEEGINSSKIRESISNNSIKTSEDIGDKLLYLQDTVEKKLTAIENKLDRSS